MTWGGKCTTQEGSGPKQGCVRAGDGRAVGRGLRREERHAPSISRYRRRSPSSRRLPGGWEAPRAMVMEVLMVVVVVVVVVMRGLRDLEGVVQAMQTRSPARVADKRGLGEYLVGAARDDDRSVDVVVMRGLVAWLEGRAGDAKEALKEGSGWAAPGRRRGR